MDDILISVKKFISVEEAFSKLGFGEVPFGLHVGSIGESEAGGVKQSLTDNLGDVFDISRFNKAKLFDIEDPKSPVSIEFTYTSQFSQPLYNFRHIFYPKLIRNVASCQKVDAD
jgi:hypothetical protein